MADHDLTLTYAAGGGFEVDQPSIAVRQGETIGFSLAPESQQGTIRIKFHDHRFFSTGNPHFHDQGVFLNGDGVVTVAQALTGRTTYRCELLDDQDTVIGQSQEHGGECVPAT